MINRKKLVAIMAALVSATTLGHPSATAATVPDYTGIGSSNIASAAPGGRTIFVDDQGADYIGVDQPWGHVEYNRVTCLDTGVIPANMPGCPEATIDRPLRTVQAGVKIAKPGDVIVVRAGIYDERVGWAARPGRADAPINLQSYPGEAVQVNGYLSLTGADYWTVQGIRWGYSGTNTTGQAIVNFFGGTGWAFIRNEVAGTRGVANVLIRERTPITWTAEGRTAAAPHNYMIGANCIRNAAKLGTAGEMHNIYLMPTVYSSGGVIENNLVAGAPLGANIKASGSGDPSSAPKDVLIRNNTLLYGASGLVIGQQAERVETIGNLIAMGTQSGPYDGGVKTYDLVRADTDSVKDSLIQGYASPIRQPWQASPLLFVRRNVTPSTVTLTGSLANCTVRAADMNIRQTYGHLSTR
ncbi:hypothetical protein [Paenarthrobacter sp. NPDC090522]|uniref:hypothetical protein n=1 Tax=Paenarthrobacter sp. NPDC090522 TaxID=3364383 RepID=UPI00381E83FA